MKWALRGLPERMILLYYLFISNFNTMSSFTSFFNNLFGLKDQPSGSRDPRRVVVTSSSQPEVLQKVMREEKLSHGETVMANLSPVRLEKSRGKMVLYFCPMKSMEVLETLSAGDGGNIPNQVIVEDLAIPRELKEGLYMLKNVKVTSNGTMQVRATEQTEWKVVHSDLYSW